MQKPLRVLTFVHTQHTHMPQNTNRESTGVAFTCIVTHDAFSSGWIGTKLVPLLNHWSVDVIDTEGLY